MDPTDNYLTAILATLAPGMALFVPDEQLAAWFPPGPREGAMEPPLQREIAIFASSASCSFEYVAEKNAGRFTKLARC